MTETTRKDESTRTGRDLPQASSPAAAPPAGAATHAPAGTPGHASAGAPPAPSQAAPSTDAGDISVPASTQMKGEGDAELRDRIVAALKTCYDPEIPVDIYELGLIYEIDLDVDGNVAVKMTLTSPMCPVAGSLPPEVERKIGETRGVKNVTVDLVWEPTWEKEMMSEEARVRLNLF